MLTEPDNQRKGKLIVIDGTDGSGKETQAKLLVDRLRNEHYSVEYTDFPQYGNPSAAMVERYLQGTYGTAEEVGPFRASVFYAVDRFDMSAQMHEWLRQGKIIISNRYVSSNQGHQAGKILDHAKIDKFLAWLDNLEYNIFGIPRPDKVVLIHMPWEIGRRLKEAQRIKQGQKQDLHEKNPKHLADAEQAYLYVAKKEKWSVIECAKGGEPLPVPVIHEKIYSLISDILRT